MGSVLPVFRQHGAIVSACEYCGGRVQRRFSRIGFDGSVQDVERMTCVKCHTEQSTLCGRCKTRTQPCVHCNGQRCLCESYGHRLHWFGGFAIKVMSTKGEGGFF